MSDKLNETVVPTELETEVLETVVSQTDEELAQQVDSITTENEEVMNKPDDVVNPIETVDVIDGLKVKETVGPTNSTQVEEAIKSTEVVEHSENETHIVAEEALIVSGDNQALTPSVLKGVPQPTFERLTKKNQQYLLSVAKQLEAETLEQSTATAVFTEIADTLIEGQKTGQTAKQLYGTPTECAQIIRDQHFPKDVKASDIPSDPKLIALDGSLLLGSIYTLMTGVSMMNTQAENVGVGLLTLIVNYIVAGFAMLLIARNLPNPDAPKGEKGYFKYFAWATIAMFSWVAAVSLTTAFIPPIINPLLPAGVLVVIGLITLVGRFYIKKRFNIKGGVF